MAKGYKIREHALGVAEMRALVLVNETSDRDFIDKLVDSKRDPGRIKLIVRTLERIQLEGIARSERTRCIKVLDNNLCYAEARVPGKVIRVMCYIHNHGAANAELVLLFDFDAHQGKSNKIPKPLLKKAAELARIARETMEEVSWQ